MKGTYYWIKAEVRHQIAKRDRGICQICGRKASKAEINKRGILTFLDKHGRPYQLDHLVSASKGDHSMNNLRLSCANCNNSKRKKKSENDTEILKILSDFSK